MTREKALSASRALDAVDNFESFMEEVDKAIIIAEDFTLLSPEFKLKLENLMNAELERLKKVLEDL